ncbi:MAG: type II secretion system F family protein [Candidatus Omnitrophica bacterium]|nr:type II secretion system F family protein [Candidatus Omnitrophota bacterium]
MPKFEYLVKDQEGKDIKGVQEATDVGNLISVLRSKGYTIVRVKESHHKTLFAGRRTGKKRRITQDDLVVFSRQIATMVGAGVTLMQALDVLGEQMDNAKFQSIIYSMKHDVEGGKSFSEALMRYKNVFSSLYINMVRAGEQSGELDEILNRLATYLEKSNALRKKVQSAMIYPVVVSLFALIITVGMLTFVIPKFAEIFSGLGAKLPAPTQVLINISNVLRQQFIAVVIVLVIIIVCVRVFLSTKGGRYSFDKGILRLPVFGTLLLKVAISKFARTFATLTRSGVPVLSALDIVGKTSGNTYIERLVEGVRESVKEGESLSGPLAKEKIFPPMVVRMIAVGEETGELEAMLSKIAEFYDDQVDTAISGLTSLIEPLVIAFLGIVIGGIVICMFLPIFSLTQALK